MKCVHLDCGRKYFSIENIKALIDTMNENSYTHLELYFSDTLGFRLGLDDMYVYANNTTYDLSISLGDGVPWTRRDGSGIMNPDGSNKWLTQTEMTNIIKYAKAKNIEIIPCLDTPSHMGGILKNFSEFEYNGTASHNDLDIYNEKAVNFALAVTDKYAEYFAKQGCKYYNFGGDEVTYSSRAEEYKKSYSEFVNKSASVVIRNGLIPMAFCEAIYFGKDTGYYVNRRIISCYWSSGYNYESSKTQDKFGFELVNTDSQLYWILGVGKPSDQTVSTFNYKKMCDGNIINNARGVMLCIWCDFADTDGQDNGNNVINNVKRILSLLPNPN